MFDPALSWTTLPVDEDPRRLLAAQLQFCAAPPVTDELHQLLARLGSEEFVLMLPDTAVDSARVITRRLLGAVPDGATASAGVACWAKAAGRNQLVVASANGDS